MKSCIKNKETNVLPLGGNVFHNISNNIIVTNKNFWNFIRPFLVNKGLLNSCKIMLKEGKKIITDTKEVDAIPPKLVKFAANYLAGPLSQSINNSIKKGCFPKMQRLPQLLP